MSPQLNTEQFLRLTTPSEGLKILAEQISVPGRDKPGWRYTTYQSIEQMAEAALQLDAKGGTIYHACNGFGDWHPHPKKPGKKQIRDQGNVVACRSLYDDIDVGKPGCYATRKEAVKAIITFVKASKLPEPLIVSSGGGLHLYWPFNRDLTPQEWQRLANKKRLITKHFGLKVDPAVDIDSARILRPVGSTWRKRGQRTVRCLHEGAISDPDDFDALLNDCIERCAITPPSSESAIPSWMQGAKGNLDTLTPDYPPTYLATIAEHCAQIRNFKETGADAEPLWHACAGIAKHCVDGEAKFLEWSAKYKGFVETEAQEKLDNWTAGPTTCERFRALNESLCQGCTHSCRSPIALGQQPAMTTSTAVTMRNDDETLNDAGNADRLIAAFGERIRYVPELKAWLVWRNGHWRACSRDKIIELAVAVIRSLFNQAAETTNQADRTILYRWAKASLQITRLDAMVTLAQSKCAVSVDELDADPLVLGVRNGVVNLRNGEFRAARPEDLITKIANVDFDPGAICPMWEKTLDLCMGGDAELVGFLQRAAGYSITGLTVEQVFFFLYGTGCNGKSTIVNVLREIVGGHAVQSQPETIMAQRNSNPSGPTPEIARLAGVRFVAMVETEDGQRLAESRIKQMTGGDAMTARVLHGYPFDFVPIFKLWLAGNHRPVVRGDDHGIWRRIRIIPFTKIIPPEALDKKLPEKLRAEYPGILNWLIRGCIDWQRNGLTVPTKVAKEVEQYKSDMDLIAQWLDENCNVGPHLESRARFAYRNFAEWAKAGGHGVITEIRFAQKMAERGFTKYRSRDGQRYRGFEEIHGNLFFA